MEESSELDFFISYTQVDVAWAQWIAVELERVGYRVFAQVLDIRPGNDFVHEMQQAASSAARTIAVLSPSQDPPHPAHLSRHRAAQLPR